VLHPVHNVAAQPRGVGDAVGLRTGVPVVRLLVRGPDEVVAVRGPAGWPIQHGLDAGGLQGWHEGGGALHAVHNAVNVTFPEPVSQLSRHRALPLRRCKLHKVLGLIRAHEHAIAFVAKVIGALEVAQHRQLMPVLLVVLLDLRHGLGDHILVLQHRARRVHACKVADAPGPEACTVDNSLGADDMVFATSPHHDLPRLVRPHGDAHHLRVLIDPAAKRLRLGGEGLGHR